MTIFSRKKMFKDFIQGASYVRKGFILLRYPELRLFLIIPSAVGAIAFGFLTWASITYFSQASTWMINFLPEWLFNLILWTIKLLPAWLTSWLKIFIWLIYAFLFGMTFTTLTLFLASPFNGLLAEKAEKIITGTEVISNDSYLRILWSLPRSIFRELSKLLHYLTLVLGAIFIGIIPLLNSLAPILWLLISAWMMYMHFLDYPMDNHGHNINSVRKFGLSKPFIALGFGGMVSILATIPLLNVLVVPSAVIGATLFWCENAQDIID